MRPNNELYNQLIQEWESINGKIKSPNIIPYEYQEILKEGNKEWIPVEWINKYMNNLPDGSEVYECLLVMLEEWEKENGLLRN